jgi:type IV secretory pathway TrbD component
MSLLCASTTVEVAWVSLQHARGVPSHFNTATTLDFSLFILGGVAIVVTIMVIAAMTLAAFTGTTAPAAMAVAIRAGLVALLAAQGVGVWIVAHGMSLVNAGADPLTQSMSTYGAAGAMKFAHAVPMHAIQVFVVLAWLLSFSGLPPAWQVRLVALAVIGYAGLVGIVLLRTASGLGPFDLRSASAVGYLVAVGLVAIPVVAAGAGRRRTTPSR